MSDFDARRAGQHLVETARRGLTDTARCLRFYSRLPVPALPWEDDANACPDFSTLSRMLPLAGAAIGLIGAAVLILATVLDLGALLSATLAVATITLVTGALHEDGLADTADGFGGGTSPEQRLAIMRDSRIGSFGAAALILAFALRIGALATLADRLDSLGAAAVVMIAAALSRTAGLAVLMRLPPARSDGASHAVGQPTRSTLTAACGFAAILALALGLVGSVPLTGLLFAAGLTAIATAAFMRLSERLIGGQTGDVAGAAQQIAEIAAMIGILIAVQP